MNLNVEQLKKSENLALFLGLFAGDGCLSITHNGDGNRTYPIRFYNTDRQLVQLFGYLFSQLFGKQGKIRGRSRPGKKVLWEFEKYSVKTYKMINTEFQMFAGKKALNVSAPSFIMEGSKEIKKSFFLGLLVTDGGIRKKGDLIFHMASKQIIEDLQAIVRDTWTFDVKTKGY